MNQLDLSYYLRNVLEMTGCFNSACSAIIREEVDVICIFLLCSILFHEVGFLISWISFSYCYRC